jgi:hypothetical protein
MIISVTSVDKEREPTQSNKYFDVEQPQGEVTADLRVLIVDLPTLNVAIP